VACPSPTKLVLAHDSGEKTSLGLANAFGGSISDMIDIFAKRQELSADLNQICAEFVNLLKTSRSLLCIYE